MQHAETVTFGGSGLDRAGDLRSDAVGLAALIQDPAARAILFWRGKPLIRRTRPAHLVRLSLTRANWVSSLIQANSGIRHYPTIWCLPNCAGS